MRTLEIFVVHLLDPRSFLFLFNLIGDIKFMSVWNLSVVHQMLMSIEVNVKAVLLKVGEEIFDDGGEIVIVHAEERMVIVGGLPDNIGVAALFV